MSASWERVWLNITVSIRSDYTGVRGDGDQPSDESESARQVSLQPAVAKAGAGEVQFWLANPSQAVQLDSRSSSESDFVLTLNVVNFAARQALPEGTWFLFASIGHDVLAPATFELARAEEIRSFSQTFLYARSEGAFVVNFDFTEDDVRPAVLLHVYEFARHVRGDGSASLERARGGSNNYSSAQLRAFKFAAQAIYRVARLFKNRNSRRILFASSQSDQITGNLRAIRDRLIQRGLDKEFSFDFVYSPKGRHPIAHRVREAIKFAFADTILVDDYYPMLAMINLDARTKLIQVWHAGSGFKNVGYSRFGRYGSPDLHNLHRKYTYAIAGSDHLVDVYSEVFGIEKSAVIPTGLPRVDAFLDPEERADFADRFFAEHPELVGKKLILFAPTFRGRGELDATYDFSQINFDTLAKACGDDHLFLFRMHPFVKDSIVIPEKYKTLFYDFSRFPDGNALLHVIDLLITDYSSIIYEYSLLNRPMAFYANDYLEYQVIRGFHKPYVETAPGPVCQTMDELADVIARGKFDTKKLDRFREENFNHIDRSNSDRFIDWLLLDNRPE